MVEDVSDAQARERDGASRERDEQPKGSDRRHERYPQAQLRWRKTRRLRRSTRQDDDCPLDDPFGQRAVVAHGDRARAVRVDEGETLALPRSGKRALPHRARDLHRLADDVLAVTDKPLHRQRALRAFVLRGALRHKPEQLNTPSDPIFPVQMAVTSLPNVDAAAPS